MRPDIPRAWVARRATLQTLQLMVAVHRTAGTSRAVPDVFVYWATNPVHPNESAVVAHSPAGRDASIELCASVVSGDQASCQPADLHGPPVAGADEISTIFTVPAELPLTVMSYRIARADGSKSAWHTLNQPDTLWSVGDRGRWATAGAEGVVRVSGRSLAFDNGTCLSASTVHSTDSRMRLVAADGQGLELTNVRGSCYDLTADVPATTPPGYYKIEVKNGLAGCPWTKVLDKEPLRIVHGSAFPPRQFDVAQFSGSVGAALAAAGKAGGGYVLLQPGLTYHMASNETLYIPDKTMLTTGAGGERATLLWTSESPRRPGSKGTCGNGTFGLSRVHARAPATVYLVEIMGPSHGAVVTDNRLEVVGMEECGSGKYINVSNTLHIGQATGFFVARNEIHHANEGRPFQPGGQYGGGSTPAPCGQNSPYAFSINEGAQDGVFENNTVVCGCNGWYAQSIAQLWIENNAILAVGEFGGLEGSGATSASTVPRAIHFALLRNRFRGTNAATGPHASPPNRWSNATNWGPKYNPSVPLESFTTDGSYGGYWGRTQGSASTTVTLPAGATVDPNKNVGNTCGWEHGAIVVVNGTGQGQIRTVVSPCNGTATIEVDRPFDIDLDQTSVISMIPFVGRWVIAGNTFANGTVVQNYGIALQCVMADNHLENMTCSGQVKPAGMHITSLGHYGSATMPNMYMELLRNSQSFSSGLHVGGGYFPWPVTANTSRLSFGVAVRGNRHVNPPPHEYLDNSAVCHNGGANGGGCTVNSLPGQLTVSQGVQTILLEHNSLEVRNDINYSQGYKTINVGPHPTTVVQRHNLVVEV